MIKITILDGVSNYIPVNPDMTGFSIRKERVSNYHRYTVSGEVVFSKQTNNIGLVYTNDFDFIRLKIGLFAKLYQNGKYICDLKAPRPSRNQIDYDNGTITVNFEVAEKQNLLTELADRKYNILELAIKKDVSLVYKTDYIWERNQNNIFEVSRSVGSFSFDYFGSPTDTEPLQGIEPPDGELPVNSNWVPSFVLYSFENDNGTTHEINANYSLFSEVRYSATETEMPTGFVFDKYVDIGGFTYARFIKRPFLAGSGIYNNTGTVTTPTNTYIHAINNIDFTATGITDTTYTILGGVNLKDAISFLVGKNSTVPNFNFNDLTAVLGEVYLFPLSSCLQTDGLMPDVRAVTGRLSFTELMDWLHGLGFEWHIDDTTFYITHPTQESLPASTIDFNNYNGFSYLRRNRKLQSEPPEYTILADENNYSTPGFFGAEIKIRDFEGFTETLEKYQETIILTDIEDAIRTPGKYDEFSTEIFFALQVDGLDVVKTEISPLTGKDTNNFGLSLYNLASDVMIFPNHRISLNGTLLDLNENRKKERYYKEFEIIMDDLEQFNFAETYEYYETCKIDSIELVGNRAIIKLIYR